MLDVNGLSKAANTYLLPTKS